MTRNTLHEIKIVTAPTINPVTDAETKTYLKIDFTADDTLIANLIKAATREAEQFCGRSFITQTLKAHWYSFSEKVMLPMAPVQSVSSVDYIRLNNTTSLTVNTDYYLNGLNDKYILLAAPYRLPAGHSPFDRYDNYALEVQYVAGYGSATTDVPEDIRTAILRIVKSLYDHRDDMEDKGTTRMPYDAKLLLSHYRIY